MRPTSRSMAALASFAALGLAAGVSMPDFGSLRVKRKYGKCESCGNPTRDARFCHKCKEKQPQATPAVLVIHTSGRYEKPYTPPYQTLIRPVEINGHTAFEKL